MNKICTTIEQSKKLAEILPIESADMHYVMIDTENEIYSAGLSNYIGILPSLPCWSLAALLDVLPDSIYDNTDEYSQLEFSKISVAYHDMNNGIKVGSIKDNLVDACYEMIIKLKELNLL